MPFGEDMKDIVEDIVSSYEARIQSIGAIFDTTQQILEGLRRGFSTYGFIHLGRLLFQTFTSFTWVW